MPVLPDKRFVFPPYGGGSAGTTPTLVQHFSSSANPVGIGSAGHTFKIPLANPVLAGNCLILGITYPNGSDPTSVSDNLNGTWGAAVVTVDAGVGAYVLKIYVFPNAVAGQTTITVAQSADLIPFQYEVSEFYNVATVSPVNGTSSASAQTGAALSTGSFTPGNNNANGGNLIWNYYGLAAAAGSNPTKWVSGGSFSLLGADIAWTTNQGVPHACQYFVQATSTAINPGITATADTVNAYNCAAVALKAANAGTAPAATGIRIVRILHQSMTNAFPNPWKIQMPSSGNLLVLTTANPQTTWAPSSITDSNGNTWVKHQPANDQPQIWTASNATSGADLLITVNLTASAQASIVLYDIIGAAVSPVDQVVGKSLTDCSGVTSISSAPSITPTTTNGLVIALVALGQGPGLSVTSPSGAVFDLCTYVNEIDAEFMENADLKAHLYNATTAAQSWNWTITNIVSNSYAALAVSFKAA